MAAGTTGKSSRRARIPKSCSTEKNDGRRRSQKSPISEPISAGESFVFSVLQPCKILVCREDFTAALAASRPPKNCRHRLAVRPGGTPQEISRGQARASGRRPRLARRTGHAPAGHRRNFGWRPPRSIAATTRRLGPIGQPGIGQQPGPFSSMPRWGTEPLGTVSGGRRPLARTCFRLISSGVPPGRETGGHALPKGNPRRGSSVPKSFGCGFAALCSSCLCGPLGSARPNSYG